jgi:hypothetical protein
MHKSATKCNETVGKWCKNKHGALKIIDTFETYQYGQKLKLGDAHVTPRNIQEVHASKLGMPPRRPFFIGKN